MPDPISYYAFTTKIDGLAKVLRNEAQITANGQSQKVSALWDTGATRSCVSTKVATDLNLISTGKNLIKTPSGQKEVNTYLVDIGLPNNVNIKDLIVCDSDIGDQGLDMLIGMDIIGLGDFSVSNYLGKTTFSVRIPSKKTTDYVEEINKEKLLGPPHGKGKRKHKR